jgi:alpha-galactosidase
MLIKKFAFVLLLLVLSSSVAFSQASITTANDKWTITNGKIRLVLSKGSAGAVTVTSLALVSGGAEWAAPGTQISAAIESSAGFSNATFRFVADKITPLPGGAKQLELRLKDPSTAALLSLRIRVFPETAALQFSARLENDGKQTLPAVSRLDPLQLTLGPSALNVYSTRRRQHGFFPDGSLDSDREFTSWTVFENGSSRESLLVGGEPGGGILQWRLNATKSDQGFTLRAGNVTRTPQAQQVAPGTGIDTPIAFLSLAKGEADEVTNETFRYLKRYVFQAPLPNGPPAVYNLWFTDPDSEATLYEELRFARRVGFDVLVHDAGWFEGASTVPGMNDWSKGLGSYQESRVKFPSGMRAYSNAVRRAGLKFGLWVDPPNVDASRVKSGEIPEAWLAKIDGKELGNSHPSLTTTKQLCLGNPKVVAWLKVQLGTLIATYDVEWIKWDPSATTSYSCDRTDHGHGATDGAYAAYRGRMEILRYLMQRFPQLSGFEVDPSLEYSRVNPAPKELLPGGYVNEFITGPMVSPHVWGSFSAAGVGDAAAAKDLVKNWFSASALDYDLRAHFMRGISFGNINGMVSQRLSQGPPGYIEALKRNLQAFKGYRHLLREDVYHLHLKSPENWRVIEYVDADSSEAVVFVFRDGGVDDLNVFSLKGLEPNANYLVTSLNDRPGRERIIRGAELMTKGINSKLPDEWLSKGDNMGDKNSEDQVRTGSDIILFKRLQK